MRLFRLLIFIIVFSVTVYSQSIQIAKVDSAALEDDKTGIKELIGELAKLKLEFKSRTDELKLLADKITKFQKEIQAKYKDYGTSCPIGPSKIQEEAEVYEKLIADFKENQENTSSLFEKRRKELTEPIYKRIGAKLVEFNKIKGFAFIYDSADVNSIPESIDVTQDFIKFCNEEFEKEKLNR
jgi:Skp family chaperone for outer membrane proteins